MVFDVRAFERQANPGNLLDLVASERELEVVAFPEFPQLFDLIVVAGNERAEFAAGHAEVAARGV